ncbi:DNA-3-methyladenine glycosylase I [Leucobacter komagatae]|uniref:3-methyladenine DNA glycosylase n=1 Tax=Leucobacter komagatae TaxID=55969 RepID=A0A0D0IQI0_9MICO|nr:DNA-3-methyladenine glycosylase I [Leucobacter komagatae]KIP53844.1 3-methyladenine DNA glycosylase [Leucobacter komagatae]
MTDLQETPVRAAWAMQDPLLTEYYDTEWGMPVHDERGLFERLTLEAFQSGLSWLTILRKRENFRLAFDHFDPAAVAAYTEDDVARLLSDAGIIRNRLKIEAAIANARAVLALHEAGETLGDVIWAAAPLRSPAPERDSDVPTTSPESVALAKELKRRGFRFVGPTTMYALMSAIGVVDIHLVSSHMRGASGLWNVDGTRRDVEFRVPSGSAGAAA